MKTLIVYDSIYGNTKKIAKVIGEVFGNETGVVAVSKINLSRLKGIDLLIVGSPTHGGRPAQGVQKFLGEIPGRVLEGVKVAVFDTRIAAGGQGVWLRMLIGIIGYAEARMVKGLQAKGGIVIAEEGFIVEGKEGPLREKELERAANWARKILKRCYTEK